MVSEQEDIDDIKSAYEQLKHNYVFLQQEVDGTHTQAAELEQELVIVAVGNGDSIPNVDEVRCLIDNVQHGEAVEELEAAMARQTESELLDAQAELDMEAVALENVEASEKIESDAAKSYAAVLQDTEEQCAHEYLTASTYLRLHHEEAEELHHAEAALTQLGENGSGGAYVEAIQAQARERGKLKQQRLNVSDTIDDLETQVDRLRSENITLTLMAAKHLQLETELRKAIDKDKTRLDEFEHESLIAGQLQEVLQSANENNVELRIAMNDSACELIERRDRVEFEQLSARNKNEAMQKQTAELIAEISALNAEVGSYRAEASMAQDALTELQSQTPLDESAEQQDLNSSAATETGPINTSALARHDQMELRILEVENQMRSIHGVLSQIQSQTANAASKKTGYQEVMDLLLAMQSNPSQTRANGTSTAPVPPYPTLTMSSSLSTLLPATPQVLTNPATPQVRTKGVLSSSIIPGTVASLERGREASASSTALRPDSSQLETVKTSGRSTPPPRGVTSIAATPYRMEARVSSHMPVSRGRGMIQMDSSPVRPAMVATPAMFLAPHTARAVLRSPAAARFPP